MNDPNPPAIPDDTPSFDPPPEPSPDAAAFSVAFTGSDELNTLRLTGDGTIWFDGGEVTIEAGQVPLSAPRRRVHFMFTLPEVRRVGLREGAIILVIEPRDQPQASHVISFYVSSEEDAQRILAILHPPQPAGAEGEPPEGYRFFERLRLMPVFATRALLAANIGVFVLMAAGGASLLDPSGEALVGWGARLNTLIKAGQWWRLLTPMFVHVGLIHLAVNMWALRVLGSFIERLFGPWRFLAIYFAAGLIGNVASSLLLPEGLAAGASGAIFGILGALVGFIIRHHRVIPRPVLVSLRKSALSMIVLNLLLGFTIPGIDNSAHIGGLLGGIALGWLLAGAHTKTTPVPLSKWAERALAAATALILVVLMVAAHLCPLPEDISRELRAENVTSPAQEQRADDPAPKTIDLPARDRNGLPDAHD